jgi:hypothetical protein
MGIFQEAAPTWVNLGMMIFGIVFCCIISIAFVVFVRRNWRAEELRVRGKVLTLTSFFGILVLASIFIFLTANNFDDSRLSVVLLWVLATPCELAFISGPIMIRGLVLLFKFEITMEQIQMMRDLEEKEDFIPLEASWFSRNRHLVSEKYQFLSETVFSAICLFIPLAIAPVSTSVFINTSRISHHFDILLVWSCYGVLCVQIQVFS